MTTPSQQQPTGNMPPVGATARLDIDLGALRANYTQLADMAQGAECAAVVKADAYGTGATQAAGALEAAGCRSFFVATLQEAVDLRTTVPTASIYVLDGLLPEAEPIYVQHRLIPVLGSLETLLAWSRFAASAAQPLLAAVHIDTGMNRLGLGPDCLPTFLQEQARYLENVQLELVISHLACADEPEHPRNQHQLRLFREALAALPPVRASLANSAGIMLGKDYHFDLVRPGIALYGGRAVNSSDNPMQPVAHLSARIAQVRKVRKGDSVGYGASFTATRDSLFATVPVGYADGYQRALGAGALAYIDGHPVPLKGRVSMDLITLDITDLPAELAVAGTLVELIGTHVQVDDLADVAGTIGYEILTSLGRRYARHYAKKAV